MPTEPHILLDEPKQALRHPMASARRMWSALLELHALNQEPAFSAYRERNLPRFVVAVVLIGAPMLVSFHLMDRALGLPGARMLLVVRIASAVSLLAGLGLFFFRRAPGGERRLLIACLYIATACAVAVEYLGGGVGNSYWVGYTTIQIFWLAFNPLPFTTLIGHAVAAMGLFELGVWALAPPNLPSSRLVESSAMLWGNLLICGGLSILRNYNSAALFKSLALQAQAEQRRDDLMHTIVHDLKTPLTAIGGSLDLLPAVPGPALSGDQSRMVEIARANSVRMQLLVETILDVGRLEAGALEPAPAEVRIEALLDEAVRLQQPVAELRGVSLRLDPPADLPPVRIDRALVGRVLSNLLANALKATPAGGRIEVAAARGNDSEFIEVTVRDSGPGIPGELQGRLFQKFATGAKGGSGIGLHFCRLAVEAHGGRIRIESAAEGGTTVRFTLPRLAIAGANGR